MKNNSSLDNLDQENTVRLIIDFIHRTIIHHGMWYAEVHNQLGREKALEILKTVYEQSYGIQMNRLSKLFGFDMKDDLPVPLLKMKKEELEDLKEKVAANWLANDGVWFQAIEFSLDMPEAKRCNDLTWAQFSPFEAWSIKKFLDLTDKPGLEGLKIALKLRVYATLNKQSILEQKSNSFLFVMNDCRVQSTRKRKGLANYPCKSGGLIEYTSFAEAIDSRIKTECDCCPPDDHPDEWYCAWRFYIE